MRRFVGRVLLIVQASLIALCLCAIVDAYVTPYQSEWLTADAFVPFIFVAMVLLCFGLLLTWAFMQRTRRQQ